MSGFRASPRLVAFTAALALSALSANTNAAPTQPDPADLVLSGGKIYTVDPAHSVAQALAVKDGKIVFVGSTADAQQWIEIGRAHV